ncbi:MAG: hypothetical protein SGPRY_012662, partial [Prymnesium sp.]
MAIQGCPFHVPDDPASLIHAPKRPEGLLDWDARNLSSLKHSHRFHFAPVNRSLDDWYGAMYASQFRRNCSRLLLVDDDMNMSGLGFTAKIWGFALLLAVRDDRVLIEGSALQNRSRWCDRAPFSFQCLYEPWTHCARPPRGTPEAVPGGRPMMLSKWPRRAAVVHTTLGRIHRQGRIWYYSQRSPVPAAIKFLFRPRAWVKAIGNCMLRNAGLDQGKFISIHIRHSVEKMNEGHKLHYQLPQFLAYHNLAKALLSGVGTRDVFLQTSSLIALQDFANFSRRHNVSVHYTDNPRSEHDTWGGWMTGSEMLQALVGAVNAYVSTHASVIASPGTSQWTAFLKALIQRTDTLNGTAVVVRCQPSMGRAGWFGVFGPNVSGTMRPLNLNCKRDRNEEK